MEDRELFPQERRPHRRRKTRSEIFKEAYLPYLILLAAAVLILILIIGALTRSAHNKENQTPAALHASVCQTMEY